MITKRAENIAAIVMLLVFLAFAVGSLMYGPRARFVPLPLSIGAILISIAQLVVQNTKAAKKELGVDTFELFGIHKTKDEMEQQSEADREAEEALKKVKIAAGKAQVAYAIPLVFTAMIFVLGFNVAIALFVTGYFRFLNKTKWLPSIVYGVGTWGFVYGMFEMGLQIGMYPGLIAIWLGLVR